MNFPPINLNDLLNLRNDLHSGISAFVNLNGNRFSINLKGFADTINRFFIASRENSS